MKNQERAYFGPKRRIEKVGNGLTRKPRKKPRFVSKPLRQLAKEVEMSWANIQSALENERNRNGIGSENVHRSNHVVPQSKQHHLYGKVGQRNPNAMKEDFSLLAVSLKSRQAILKKTMKPTIMSSTSKMKQGSVHHTKNIKMLSSQPKNLKAMPGLVHISKRRLNLDQGASTKMHKRDQPNVGNDITNNANNSRRRKELQPEEKPKSHDDNCSEGENPTHIIMKKRRRYIEINEDEDDSVDQSPEVGVDGTRLTSRDGILKDCHDKISVPFVVDYLKEHNNCWSKPIDEPVWSGLLQVGNKDYIPLSGHLSTKSCEKVHNLSKSLTRVIEVIKLPRLKVWPKRWEGSNPINDNIGLYFFPHKMRFDKYHDQLLKEVMENDLALRSIVDGVEMLMFPSTLLPKQFQTFQMKHYLWGVFKAREVQSKDGGPDHTTEATTIAADATTTAIATDAAHVACGSTRAVTDAPSIPNEDATNAPTEPNSSSIGATPSRMLAFVVKQTPRLEQLIREMQREGALVMQGEMINTIGSWPDLATMTQCGSDMNGSPGVHPRDQVSPQLDKRAPSQHGGGCYKQQAF